MLGDAVIVTSACGKEFGWLCFCCLVVPGSAESKPASFFLGVRGLLNTTSLTRVHYFASQCFTIWRRRGYGTLGGTIGVVLLRKMCSDVGHDGAWVRCVSITTQGVDF